MDYNGETQHSAIESKIEDIEDDIVDIEAEETNLSTGLITGGIISTGTPTSTFSLTAGTGHVIITDPLVNDTVTKIDVSWTAFTNVAVTNIGTQPATFIGIDQTGSIVQSSTRFTNTDRRTIIGIGTLIHQDLATITTSFPAVQFVSNPMAQLRDFATAVGLINLTGNTVSGNANLTIIKQAGSIFDLDGNYENNPQDPNIVVTPQIDTSGSGTFTYLNQDGTVSGLLTDIIPNILDDGTAYPSTTYANNRYGNQRVYLFPSGNIFIAPPQFDYSSLANAIDVINTELFIENVNLQTNATLIAVLTVKGNAGNLQTASDAEFKNVGKFGAVTGSIAVNTLQTSYDHSAPPQIVTDATRGAMVIKRGSALDTDNVLTIQNGAGTNTVQINGNGSLRTFADEIHLGSNSGISNQGTGAVAIGAGAGQTSQGSESIAIGSGSALNNQGVNSVAIGTNTANATQGVNCVSIGTNAGSTQQSDFSVAVGYNTGLSFQGFDAIAIGSSAGSTNQGTGAVAMGQDAGRANQGDYSIALGYQSAGDITALKEQGTNSVAIGNQAGYTSQGANNVAIGLRAGKTSQATAAVAIGLDTGTIGQQNNGIALGAGAGQNNQEVASISIGQLSGSNNQGASSIAIGKSTAQFTQGANSIAIGTSAGLTSQGTLCVAIGDNAGITNQGNFSTAVGSSSGKTSQGNSSLALGRLSGEINQGANSIAVGKQAGRNFQGADSIAIGDEAGLTSQGTGAVAIGTSAGLTSQGIDAIAIGNLAGSVSQTTNSTILNSSGSALQAANSGFFVKPITTIASASGLHTLVYDDTTGEIKFVTSALP